MPSAPGEKKIKRKLSSIEMTVLGLAWLRGPCTIYSIMKDLSLSASSYHKSRAGTAYSVANRLLEAGFLEVHSHAEQLVVASETGHLALRNWVGPPVSLSDVAHSADLIRLRFFFLGSVEKDQRLAFIDDCLQGLEKLQRECEALIAENQALGEYFGALATVSAVLETRARIVWLRTVRELVENPLPSEADWTEALLARIGGREVFSQADTVQRTNVGSVVRDSSVPGGGVEP